MIDLRNTKKDQNLKSNKNDYHLQVLDWQCYNSAIDDEDEEENNKNYVIQIFGVDQNNLSVSVKVTGFKPRFYVNIPKNFNNQKINILIEEVKKKVRKQYKDSINSFKILHRKKFRGFTNNEKFKFIKFTFNDTQSMSNYVRVFEKKLNIKVLHNKPKKYELYESNIEAFLRFCHIKDLKTSGWITLPKSKYNIVRYQETYSQREFTIKWKDIEPCKLSHIAPLIVLSFDIECDSSHGDFPIAKKNYKKLAAELLDCIQKEVRNEIKNNVPKSERYNMSKEKQIKLIERLINLAFSEETRTVRNLEDISFCYTKGNKKPKKKDIKEIKEKLADILFTEIQREDNCKELKEAVEHTQKLWANQSLDLLKSIAFEMGKRYSIPKKKILRRIINRDILVEKTTDLLDNFFPELEGDKVIQIGSTINRYGEENCFLKHIITLDTCNPIDGAEVISCKTEKEVLIEWAKFVRELDPDIVTGYNIFGFDFKFIFERADELDCLFEMGTLSRMKRKEIELIEKNLSSSALGENILTYLNMEGRVVMDLLKVVQKDYKLVSYKLDSVAENFINGKINDIENNNENQFKSILTISGVNDINEGNFVSIFFNNDKYMEGKKFMIQKIVDNKLYFNDLIPEEILNKKPSWRLAKDDIGPKDIFRLQKQDAEGRKIVAKYCIQDCALCNKLVNKLSIISNNIGMANVCSVPLSYIFLRGQGVKIFSLVSKECREHDFLLPVLKKPKSQEDQEKDKKKKISFYKDEEDDSDDEIDEGGYEGAIVLPPNPGIYLECPVPVLDYSSLYPSSMISENLSHDTYVMEEKYNNLPGLEYLDITHDVYEWIDPLIKSKGKRKVGQKTCRFVQFPDGKKGIIPMILQKLLKARKTTRKKIPYKTVKAKDGREFSGLLETDTDTMIVIKNVEGDSMEFIKKNIESIKDTYNEFEQEVLDGLQLAYKVTANSLYGQIGAITSPIYLKDIAATTCATGRNLLHLAKEKTEEKFEGAKIVYGDSVLGDTPIILMNKKNNDIEIKQIDEINKEIWKPYEEFKKFDTNRFEKEQKKCNNYKIYTKNGWSDINRIIRHKTTKKIYRIVTHDSIVDVTEDHSLIDENLNILKPKDVNVGTKLLNNYLLNESNNETLTFNDLLNYNNTICKENIEIKKAYIYGFFYGDGSCGKYNCPSGLKYSWALNNSEIENCMILQSLLMEIYEEEFKIIDTIKSSGVYKIIPKKKIKKYVLEYRDKFYNKDKYKLVPKEILNSNYNIKKAFFCGYYLADGYKCKKSKSRNIILTNKGKIGTSMLYYIAKSLGFNVSINTRNDKINVYKLTCSFKKQRKKSNIIKKIDVIKTIKNDEYVYDIETKNGTFNTGFPLIVKNTDSIFINFNPKDENGNKLINKEGLKRSIELGLEAEKYIQQFLKPPHKLEYEKTFWPFILFTKKRYIGNKYEFDLDKFKQTSMGIVLKRRDNADIVKHIYGGIMDIIMSDKDIKKSITFLQKELKSLIQGKFPLEMLQITKSLKSYYKNPESICHKVLADRIGEREPGNKPLPNDRIPYIYIQVEEKKGQKILQGDKVEHPNFIKSNKLKPDYLFYITNQIKKPVCQIYALIVDQLEGYNYDSDYLNRLYQSYVNKHGEQKANEKLTDKKNEIAGEILFKDVVREGTNKKNNIKPITSWFKPI